MTSSCRGTKVGKLGLCSQQVATAAEPHFAGERAEAPRNPAGVQEEDGMGELGVGMREKNHAGVMAGRDWGVGVGVGRWMGGGGVLQILRT